MRFNNKAGCGRESLLEVLEVSQQDSSITWQALWMESFEGSMSSLDRRNRSDIRKVGMLHQLIARLTRHSETVAVITVPWKLQKPWFPEQQLQNSR